MINKSKTVLVLHGVYGFAGWQNWLSDQLTKKGYQVIMPNFPNPDHPDRMECLQLVKTLLQNIDPANLTIIGHSLGVATACDFLETISIPIACLISVSGFGKNYGEEINDYFMKEKDLNYNIIIQNTKQRIVMYGDNDPYVPQDTLSEFAHDISADDIYIVENGGHLSTSAGFVEFPLLLDVIA